MKKTNKGFTLIELLVVIAIIGILSSITFVMLNSARKKAYDSKVQQTLKHLQTQAALYYAENGFYTTNTTSYCDPATTYTAMYSDPRISRLFDGIDFKRKSGSDTHQVCPTISQKYLVFLPLKSKPDYYWCVDSYGNSLMGPQEKFVGGTVGNTIIPNEYNCASIISAP